MDATRGVMDRTTNSRKLDPQRTAVKDFRQLEFDELGEFDREIVLLRHFENLTNTEAANMLGLSKTASSNRYTRALKRLRDRLTKRVKHDARDTGRSTEA